MTPQGRWSEEEYLALERAAERKSEYRAGKIVAMAGASEAHSIITAHILRLLDTQFEGRPCRVYPSDLRVKVSETGLYTYPDVVIVCGEQQFDDEHRDTLLNPTLIVEVLSPSTEAYDRGEKFDHYSQLESLQEYVMIAQDRPRVERYVRQPGGQDWLLTMVRHAQGSISLPSIGCELSLAEVYDKVDLPPEPPSLHREQT